MLDVKKQAKLEQEIAEGSEFLPRIWRGLFNGCIKEKFTEQQAMELVKTYIIAK